MIACFGCGKEHKYNSIPHVEMADGKDHPFCPGRSYNYPKSLCYDMAVQREKFCPGCGKPGLVREVGYLCQYCTADLERGRTVTTEPLFWYYTDIRSWFPTWPSQEQRELVEAYLISIGHRVDLHLHYNSSAGFYKDDPKKRLLMPNRKAAFASGTSPSYVAVELTEAEAEAARTFLTRLLNMLKTERIEGRKEGRSLLAGLASGELSIADFNETNDKLTKGKDF